MNAPTTYTTTIVYDADNEAWTFSTNPPPVLGGQHGKTGKYRHGDILNWICSYGNWAVYFDGETPLVNLAGNPVGSVSGFNATSAGAFVAKKAVVGQSYSYRVVLDQVDGSGIVVSADPEIIIDTDSNPDTGGKKAKKKKKKAKKSATVIPSE